MLSVVILSLMQLSDLLVTSPKVSTRSG